MMNTRARIACLAGLWTACLVVLGFGPCSLARGQGVSPRLQQEAAKAVQVRLISDVGTISPGRPATLGLELLVAKGWHVYWRNAGDSGLPIGFEWETPTGVSVGEAQWPAPERHVAEGDILDYVYHDRVVLLFPLVVSPSDSPSTGTLKIKCKVDWLVCREACVPGGREVELELRVGAEAEVSSSSGQIAEARRLIPVLAGAEVRATWSGCELVVECPGAIGLTFMPYESGGASPLDMVKQGEGRGAQLRVPYPASVSNEKVVRGVVRIEREGRVEHRVIEVAPPAKTAE